MVVTGIGTSVSYHIAFAGSALNKRQRLLDSRSKIRLYNSADFQNDNKKKRQSKSRLVRAAISSAVFALTG